MSTVTSSYTVARRRAGVKYLKLRLVDDGNSRAPASASVNSGLGTLRSLTGASVSVAAIVALSSPRSGRGGGELVVVDPRLGDAFLHQQANGGVDHRRGTTQVSVDLT